MAGCHGHVSIITGEANNKMFQLSPRVQTKADDDALSELVCWDHQVMKSRIRVKSYFSIPIRFIQTPAEELNLWSYSTQ